MTPHIVSQVPEGIGKGRVAVGLAGGGTAYAKGWSRWTDSDVADEVEATAVEGQFFLDIGLNDTTDLRFRLAGLVGFQYGDIDAFFLDPGLELKFSYGMVAILVGLDFAIAVEPGDHLGPLAAPVCYDECNLNAHFDHSFSMGSHGGAVIGFGDPGSIRFLLMPRIGVTSFLLTVYASLALGLDVPLDERVSLRPQIDGTCYASWAEHHELLFCGAGAGVGLVF